MATIPATGSTAATNGTATTSTGKRKEIYKHEAAWNVFAMNWSARPNARFRLAVGSFIEEYSNKVAPRDCMRIIAQYSLSFCLPR